MPRVVHFEFQVDDVERASEFYREVFGWEIFQKGEKNPYWLIYTGLSDRQGINGGLTQRKSPKNSTIVSIEVENLDKYVKQVESHGGKAITQRITLAGAGFIRYCTDTEGNTFCLIEKDPSAK